MRLVITDADGPLRCGGQTLPGASHDPLTQLRQAGPVERPAPTLLADAGCQGLSALTAGAVLPRPARRKNQMPVLPASPPRTRPNAGPTPETPPASGSASSRASPTGRPGGPGRGVSAPRAPDHHPARGRRTGPWPASGASGCTATGTGRTTRTRSSGCRPIWVGWTHPVTVRTVRSRPEPTRWCRARGSTVTEFDGRAPRRVLALLHRAADERMTP
jgi:hypothetical protein